MSKNKPFSKSAVQLAYTKYATALLDTIDYVPWQRANELLRKAKVRMENDHRTSLIPLQIHYEDGKYFIKTN